jgi:hypothetical protein
MMSAYLKVIQKTLNRSDSKSYVHEDALMAIGSLATGLLYVIFRIKSFNSYFFCIYLRS